MAKPKSDKPRKERAPKAAKPKLAAIDADQQQATFFQHKRALAPLLVSLRECQADVKRAYELAKAEGVSKRDLDFAFKLDTDDGEAKAKAELATMMRVAQWVGASIGSQLDMFGGKPADKHFEEGKRHALEGGIRKAPGHIGHDQIDQWFAGFDAGDKAMNAVESVGRGAQAKADFVNTIGG